MKNCEPLVPGPAFAMESVPGLVMLQAGVEFVCETIARTATTGTCGIAALNHKIGDHPVEKSAIKESLPGKEHKIVHRLGGFIGEELQLDISLIRVQGGGIFLLRVDG